MCAYLNFFVRWVSFLLITLKNTHQWQFTLYPVVEQCGFTLTLCGMGVYLVTVTSGWAGAEATIRCASRLVPIFGLGAVHPAHLLIGILEYQNIGTSEYRNIRILQYWILPSLGFVKCTPWLTRVCPGSVNESCTWKGLRGCQSICCERHAPKYWCI